MIRTLSKAAVGVAVVMGIAALAPAHAAIQADARPRPPVGVSCPRGVHYLTAYIGVVTRYAGGPDRTTLTIRTDWDTTEDVTLDHKGSSDPAKWFLYRGDAFQAAHWEKIKNAMGELRRNIRATAWVCSDGSNPIIDWDTPGEP